MYSPSKRIKLPSIEKYSDIEEMHELAHPLPIKSRRLPLFVTKDSDIYTSLALFNPLCKIDDIIIRKYSQSFLENSIKYNKHMTKSISMIHLINQETSMVKQHRMQVTCEDLIAWNEKDGTYTCRNALKFIKTRTIL